MKKKMNSRKIMSCLLTAAMVAGLAGCGSNASADTSNAENTAATETSSAGSKTASAAKITYANFNASGGKEETLDKMYEAFHKEYPDIEVEIETIGYDDYFTQMQTRVAGGTAPDCFELNIENFAAYSSKGLLAPITDLDTAAYNQTALKAFQSEGTQYGLPGNFSNVVMIYNKELFDQAKVEYPTKDWTWDDAQKAAEAITALGDDISGIYAPITYNEFYKVIAQFDGTLLNEDKTEFTINSKENLQAANMMVNRVVKSKVSPTLEQKGGSEDWNLFESGRLGMIMTGIWAFSEFADACTFDWDICVEPGQTQKATHFFSNALVINTKADAQKQKAAATWINWLASSSDSAKIRLDANWDLPAISDTSVLAGYLEQTPPENKQAVFDSLDSLVMSPIIEDYSMMADIITAKLEEAESGKITAEEALNQAQEECTSKITLK